MTLKPHFTTRPGDLQRVLAESPRARAAYAHISVPSATGGVLQPAVAIWAGDKVRLVLNLVDANRIAAQLADVLDTFMASQPAAEED